MRREGGLIMNFGRLLLYLLASASMVFATTTGLPTLEKGEWVITGEETITDSVINAVNVTIESGGALTLSGSTLQLTNPPSSTVWVKAGGTLKIFGNSAVTTTSATTGYLFWADPDSVLEIMDSAITKCGFNSFDYKYAGPYVRTNAIINNSIFEYNFDGLIIRNSPATITNSNFTNNEEMGIFLHTSKSSILQGNEIKNNGAFGVEVLDGSDNALAANVVENNLLDSVYIHGNSADNIVGGTLAGGLSLNASANSIEDAYISDENANVTLYAAFPGQTLRNVEFARGAKLTIEAVGTTLENVTMTDAEGIVVEGSDTAAKENPITIKNSVIKIRTPATLPPITASLMTPKQAVIVRAAYTKIGGTTIEAENATALLVENADGVTVTDTVLQGSQPPARLVTALL